MSARQPRKRTLYACVACSAALLFGCEGSEAEGGTSRYLAARNDAPDCTGAFTPNSEVCYDKTEVQDGPITTDTTMSEGLLADVENVDRCLRTSVSPAGTPATLTVSFTTQILAGTYQPRNVGAAWIEDSMGQYVRTLEAWAGERVQSITMWFPRACHTDDKTQTRPDVSTSETLLVHKTHTSTWDGVDFHDAMVGPDGKVLPNGKPAADGKYTLWLQVTESEFVPEGPYMMIPFDKGAEPWEKTPTPIPGFADIKLTYKPGVALQPGPVKP
jgi:hypothetical protein